MKTILAAILVLAAAIPATGQQTRRATDRLAPVAATTPTPTPTPTPPPKCEAVETPWGGSQCDVTEVCFLNLVPMFVITSQRNVIVGLDTSESTNLTEKTVSYAEGGAKKFEIGWEGRLIWAEWWVRLPGEAQRNHPIQGCYCDERRNVVVICSGGQFNREIAVAP